MATKYTQFKSTSYEGQKQKNKAYDSELEKILIRLPKGSKDKINIYLKKKADEYARTRKDDDPKYNAKFCNPNNGRISIAALVKNLLESEMGESLD